MFKPLGSANCSFYLMGRSFILGNYNQSIKGTVCWGQKLCHSVFLNSFLERIRDGAVFSESTLNIQRASAFS